MTRKFRRGEADGTTKSGPFRAILASIVEKKRFRLSGATRSNQSFETADMGKRKLGALEKVDADL
jgi:hypothetical protein